MQASATEKFRKVVSAYEATVLLMSISGQRKPLAFHCRPLQAMWRRFLLCRRGFLRLL